MAPSDLISTLILKVSQEQEATSLRGSAAFSAQDLEAAQVEISRGMRLKSLRSMLEQCSEEMESLGIRCAIEDLRGLEAREETQADAPAVDAAPVKPAEEVGAPAEGAKPAQAAAPVEEKAKLAKGKGPRQEADLAETKRSRLESQKADRVHAEQSLRNLMAKVNALSSREDRGASFVASAKAALCYGRAIVEGGLPDNLLSSAEDEILTVLQELDRATDVPFWGESPSKLIPADLWSELSDAYDYLADAEVALDWMESADEAIKSAHFTRAIDGVAAAETYLKMIYFHKARHLYDVQPKQVNIRLQNLTLGWHVPEYWSNHGGIQKLPTLRAAAAAAAGTFKESVKSYKRAVLKDAAMDALKGFVQAPTTDDFPKVLNGLIEGCLKAGIAPSNKDLVSSLLPFADVVRSMQNKGFEALVKYLDQKAQTNCVEDASCEEEIEDVVDEQFALKQSQVRDLLKGKKVLFVGGNKVSGAQRSAIKSGIGCKELIWPGSDDHTPVSFFYPYADKADVVCYLVRWSRHGFKQVLDYGKAHGKDTVTLPSGIGVNRVVSEIYEQILAPKHERNLVQTS
jgi:hypothetical protein